MIFLSLVSVVIGIVGLTLMIRENPYGFIITFIGAIGYVFSLGEPVFK